MQICWVLPSQKHGSLFLCCASALTSSLTVEHPLPITLSSQLARTALAVVWPIMACPGEARHLQFPDLPPSCQYAVEYFLILLESDRGTQHFPDWPKQYVLTNELNLSAHLPRKEDTNFGSKVKLYLFASLDDLSLSTSWVPGSVPGSKDEVRRAVRIPMVSTFVVSGRRLMQ